LSVVEVVIKGGKNPEKGKFERKILPFLGTWEKGGGEEFTVGLEGSR